MFSQVGVGNMQFSDKYLDNLLLDKIFVRCHLIWAALDACFRQSFTSEFDVYVKITL